MSIDILAQQDPARGHGRTGSGPDAPRSTVGISANGSFLTDVNRQHQSFRTTGFVLPHYVFRIPQPSRTAAT